MKLRFALPEDVSALLDIYAHYLPTTVTFEYTLPSPAEFARRVAQVSTVYPYLVLVDNQRILGYSYAHPIAERAAYGWGAELSIYLHPGAAGQGLGKRLYQILMELLRQQGVKTVYGLVASPNPASESLHQSLGFQLMGVQHKAGYKNGRWIDLLWYEKPLGPYTPEPSPVIPVKRLPQRRLQDILNGF